MIFLVRVYATSRWDVGAMLIRVMPKPRLPAHSQLKLHLPFPEEEEICSSTCPGSFKRGPEQFAFYGSPKVTFCPFPPNMQGPCKRLILFGLLQRSSAL